MTYPSASSRLLHPDPNVAARLEATPIARLVRQTVITARSGAEVTLSHRHETAHWLAVEAAVAYAVANISTKRWFVLDNAHAALRTADPDGNCCTEFHKFLEGHDNCGTSWRPLVPDGQLPAILDELLMWQTAWHLLAANVPIGDIVSILGVATPKPQIQPEPEPWHRLQLIGSAVPQDFARFVATVSKDLWSASSRKMKDIRERQAVAERRREEQIAANRAAVAARAKADTAARAASHVAHTATRINRSINGRALHGSVFGTWLMLVLLSWVSLLWGAMISVPFGIGGGIIASLFAGLIAVPLWGTVWGFLGMGRARESTLRDMGFKALPPDDHLAVTTATYAAALDLPMPQLGTIKAMNAFAMGSSRSDATVAIGRPLIEKLNPDEVNAIIGHELGHIASGDMKRMMLMRTFQNATVWFGLAQGLKQFARWVICWAAELAILAFSRRREYCADAVGAALAGKDAMIGALRKLDKAPALTSEENTHARFMFRGRALSTHPSMAERIAALEAETYIRQLPLKKSP